MYDLSDFQKIAGLLSTVGAVTGGGSSGNQLTDISKLVKQIKDFGSSVDLDNLGAGILGTEAGYWD
jgi:hypothetical protein